jgi:hypothetical protein
MSRINKIATVVQRKIIGMYKQKLPDGGYEFTLRQIADMNFVSLTAVNSLARQARVWRPRRAHKLHAPTARILKLLRDATEPGITYAEVGRRNARIVFEDGKQVIKPLTKQRVKQIIDFWRKRNSAIKIRSRGFKPNDIIEWDNRQFSVLRYDNARQGAVREISDGRVIDPFNWIHDGCRSKLIKTCSGKAVATA